MREGAGRKPRPVEEKQRNRLMVSLTDSEYAELENAAGNEPLGTFARRVLKRYLARRKK